MTTIDNDTPAPMGLRGTKPGRIFFADSEVEPTIAIVDLENTSPSSSRRLMPG